jgi:hypothetical protein
MSAPTAAELNEKVLKKVRRRRLPMRPLGDRGAKRFVMSVSDLENEDDVRTTIMSRLRQSVQARRPWEDEWWQVVQAWLQRPTQDREDGWESDRYLPIIFKHVETAVPIIVSAVIDADGAFEVESLTPDGHDVASAQKDLLNWQVSTTAKADIAWERMFFWSALIGTGYAEHFWEYRRERRFVPKVVIDPKTGRKVKRMLEADVVTRNNPRVKCLNPLHVWPDPDSEPGDDNEWYIVRTKTTIKELKRLAEQGGHIDKDALDLWLEDAKPGDDPLDAQKPNEVNEADMQLWEEWLRDAGLELSNHEPRDDDSSDGEKSVIVLRYVSKEETVTLGDPKHIIGVSRNPNTHGKTGIITHQFVEIPDCPYGRGIGQILLGHQQLANQNVNAWMDSVMLALMAPIEVDKNKVSVLEEDFIWEPNKLIRSRGGGAVKRVDLPAPTALALQVDAHLAHDADDATGFAGQARGVAPAASTTATAFNGIANNLSTRLVCHVRRSARTLSMSGDLLLALDQQYLDEAQMVKLAGEEALGYRMIQPEEIVGKSVVRCVVNTGRVNPDMTAQRLIQFLQVITPLLQAGAATNPIVLSLLRSIAKKLDLEKADVLFPKVFSKARDPLMENAYIGVGGHVDPLPMEDHWAHATAHLKGPGGIEDLTARAATPGANVNPEAIKELQRHVQAHLDAAAQAGMAAAQPGGALPAGAPPAAAGARASTPAGVAAGAAGANGTPGVAAPGPGAPVGRPL